jgi:hypothetical protein
MGSWLIAGLFLSTRVTAIDQTLQQSCLDQPARDCQYEVTGNSTFFIPDVEFSTLLIDHMMIASAVGISRASLDMSGSLVGADGRAIDPCDDYRQLGLDCPPAVRVGSPGRADIIPVQTLLRAAGVGSLDQRAGELGPLQNETLRFGGLVVVLSIEYSNYLSQTGSWSEGAVGYRYVASAVPNSEFKAEEVLPNPGAAGAARTVLDRHGVRFVVKQSGAVGTFDTAVHSHMHAHAHTKALSVCRSHTCTHARARAYPPTHAHTHTKARSLGRSHTRTSMYTH